MNAGSTPSFSETVTAPSGNGSFAATTSVTGSGTNPLPASWITAVTPGTFSFVTGSNQGQPKTGKDDTESLNVAFNVPSNAAPGAYTATILVQHAGASGVGAGDGTDLTLNIGDFNLGASPTPLSLVRGGSAATSTITVSSLFQFSSAVGLSGSATDSSGHSETAFPSAFHPRR